MSNAENLSPAESKMLRTLQAHSKQNPDVPYVPAGPGWSAIMDLEKRGLVMCSEPKHPDERHGYILSGAGIAAVDALTAIQHPEDEFTLTDEVALRIFSAQMIAKLRKKAAQGRGGWQTCSQEDLTRMLREHVEKGDPVDVANFCMMLAALGMSIGPAAFDGKTVADRLDQMADAQPSGSSAQSDLYAAATVWRKHLAPPVERRETEEFCEGQWWLEELDTMVKTGTPNQKRAVAVVRNMMGQLAGAQAEEHPECFCVEHGLHIEALQQRLAEAEALLTQVTENEQDGIPHATIGEFLARDAQAGTEAQARADVALKPYLAAVDEGIRRVKEGRCPVCNDQPDQDHPGTCSTCHKNGWDQTGEGEK